MWLKKHKWKILIPLVIVALLVGAFWYGGNSPASHGWSASASTPAPAATAPLTPSPAPENSAAPVTPSEAPVTTPEATPEVTPAPAETPAITPAPETTPEVTVAPETEAPEGYEYVGGMLVDKETGKDAYLTDPVPEGKPLPVEPQDVTVGSEEMTCTLSVSCASILDNLDYLDPEKLELVPEDGVILPPTVVTFYEGENVFNVLQRTLKQQRIHMEFTNTPIYNSAYIEGIHNLYEFDCGELSGWMYSVNGWFPNYGCSRYQLQDGDVIEWLYTCDLGEDVGGGYAAGRQSE